jgi:hypothetical protein
MKRLITGLCLVAAVAGFVQTAPAAPASVLLEQGSYTEETVGDVKKAIEIYRQIVDDGQDNRRVAAEALFRLGRCYAAEGKKAVALEVLEKLTRQFPEQDALLEQAAKLIPDVRPPLPLQEAPWNDGEVLRYRWATITGIYMRDSLHSVYGVEQDGIACWKMQTQVLAGSQTTYEDVIVDKVSFVPRSSHHWTSTNLTAAVFAPGQVTFTKSSDSKNPTIIDVSGSVFDGEQVINAIRCLPLQEGYQAILPTVVLENEALFELRIQVLAREAVTVPVGAFDCWKVEGTLYFDGAEVLEVVYWFSVKERVPVKASGSNGINLELVEQRMRGAKVVTLEKHDVSLKMPTGWYQHEFSDPRDGDVIALLLSPKINVNARFLGHPPLPNCKNVADTITATIKKRTAIFDNYTVRAGSRTSNVISGCPSEVFIADYVQGGNEMVELRACYYTDSYTYWLEFFALKGELESIMQQLDDVINGVSFSRQP